MVGLSGRGESMPQDMALTGQVLTAKIGVNKPPSVHRHQVILAAAIAAEIAYVAGRFLVRSSFEGPIATELATTAWRLPFMLLYIYLVRDVFRSGMARRGLPRHVALAIAVVLALLVMPLAGHGLDGDLKTRLVFALTTPVVALREELFYRAILQNALERAVHPVAAILISTALFVPFHIGMQPMDLVTISFLAAGGVLLGVIYQRTRSLFLVVTLHLVVDLAFLFPRFQVIQPVAALFGNLIVIFAALIWWMLDRQRERMSA
jgi:membrane protease YdiL (CAAX protease family)